MENHIDYQGLSLAANQIRLVQLRSQRTANSPSTEDDILVCGLDVFTRGDCPPFLALSYAWDSGGPNVSVLINDKTCQVSETVAQALGQLRESKRTVLVWIDQLCINQKDDIEKALQVQQMRHIYTEAESVIAWLGMPFLHSDVLFKYLNQTGAAVLKEDGKKFVKLHNGSGPSKHLRGAFRLFCQRKYWTRLWIMQEFAVPRHVRILCGGSSIEPDVLESAMWAGNFLDALLDGKSRLKIRPIYNQVVAMINPVERTFVDSILTRRIRYHGTYGETDHFFRVLVTCLSLEHDYNTPLASDPRDRVFALLHLATDAEEFDGSFVDYTKSCEQVYTEAAVAFLRQGHIDVLSYCQFPKKLVELPTWVPDWSMDIRNPCSQPPWFTKFRASADTLAKQRVYESKPRHLSIRGVAVDTITECGGVWDPNWLEPVNHAEALVFVDDILRLCGESPRISAGEELFDAVRVAYEDAFDCDDKESDAAFPQEDFIGAYHSLKASLDSDKESEDQSEDEMSVESGEKSGDKSSWLTQCLLRLHSRRSFISTTGFVGLCPLHTEAGDVLCIFNGGNTPYVLRPGKYNTHTVIGEAYVHGIMYGEFLKGRRASRTFILK